MGGPLKASGIKGNAQSYFFKLTQPLIQTAKSDLFFYTGYDLVKANTTWNGAGIVDQKVSDYTLNVIRSGLYGMRDDNYGRWIGSANIDFGVGGQDKFGSDSDTAFIKLGASATRAQRLFSRGMGIVRVGGQYSPNKLFPAEQMQVGGPYNVRGYQPAEIIGDYGVTATAEYRMPLPLLDKIWPWLDDRLRIAAFYDMGYIGTNGDTYGYPQKFLQSAGVGTYLTLADWITAQIGVSFPFDHHYCNNTARLYFSVNSDLDRLIPLRNPEKL